VRLGRSTKQRIWLGPRGYLCGCQRRVANAHTYANGLTKSNTNGNGDADSNPNGYIDANREPDAHSHNYTETSSFRSASSHTAA
jgi:hypothetical protein